MTKREGEERIRPPDEKPTRVAEVSVLGTKYTHPAFGTIACSHVSGTTSLFMSEVTAQNFIAIRLSTAHLYDDAHQDKVFADKIIAEVYLSEAQWAEFVSRPNYGSGVPCTIALKPVGYKLEHPPGIVRETAAERMNRRVGQLDESSREHIEKFSAQLVEIARKHLPKKALVDFERTIDVLISNLKANQDYAHETLQEHKERLVSKMKVEIDAAIAHSMRVIGVQAVKGGAAALLGAPAPKGDDE